MTVQDFKLVEPEQAARPARSPKESSDNKAAAQFLSLLLSAFSERTVSIFSAAFTVGGLALCFWLWAGILVDPSPLKLGGGSIFGGFVLLLEWVRRRK